MEVALQSLEELEFTIHKKSFQPAFTYLSASECKRELIFGVRQRLQNPSSIHQCRASLCGPASFFYCLLQDAPHKYVNLVSELYRNGYSQINKLRVAPSRACLSIEQLQGVHPADWVALASLRDGANRLFTFNQAANSFRGITWPSELAHWFRLAGYLEVKNSARLFPHRSVQHFRAIGDLINASGHLCLFVDGSTPERRFPIKGIANHWVVYNRGYGLPSTLSEGPEIKVFSWGKDDYELNFNRLAWNDFVACYFGYVYAGEYAGG